MANVEIWLEGPVDGVHPFLQHAAHGLLQVRHDIEMNCSSLEEDLLWRQAGNAATIGFHLTHVAGTIDRLLTYARKKALNEEQLAAMKAEKTVAERRPSKEQLLNQLRTSVDSALEVLRTTNINVLAEPREVGRAKLPSTLMGLLSHVAEHSQRHSGQIATTLRALKYEIRG